MVRTVAQHKIAKEARLHEESMRAYDTSTIPGLRLRRSNSIPRLRRSSSLRRPRSDDARVERLVREATQRSTDRLVQLISVRPAAGNAAAGCIRRALVDEPWYAERTLALLDALMRRCPYFYRYIAYGRFFSALWGLQRTSRTPPDARDKVLLLVRAWAEDLGAMFLRRADPPAAFWIERYHRKRRHVDFPSLPRGDDRPFVCPVRTANTSKYTTERGHVLNRTELKASLALLDRLLSAAKDAPEARRLYEDVRRTMPADNVPLSDVEENEDDSITAVVHDLPESSTDDGGTLLLPRRAGRANADVAKAAVEASRFTALNEKVLAVLRRYDDSFARTRSGGIRRKATNRRRSTDDNAIEMNATDARRASVAAVAREEARWKLFFNDSNPPPPPPRPATRYVDVNEEQPPVSDGESSVFTPATFPSSVFTPTNEDSK